MVLHKKIFIYIYEKIILFLFLFFFIIRDPNVTDVIYVIKILKLLHSQMFHWSKNVVWYQKDYTAILKMYCVIRHFPIMTLLQMHSPHSKKKN